MSAGQRIWRTEDGRYVGDGHADARILAAGPGDDLPDDFDADAFEDGPPPLPVFDPEAAIVKEAPEATDDAAPADDSDDDSDDAPADDAAPAPKPKRARNR